MIGELNKIEQIKNFEFLIFIDQENEWFVRYIPVVPDRCEVLR